MSSPTVVSGNPTSGTDELRAVDVLIAHQKVNVRLLCAAAGVMFLLASALFIVFSVLGAIKELGPALGNLLTFISGLFPVSGVIAANSRIGELEAAKLLAAKAAMTANEQELLRELLRK